MKRVFAVLLCLILAVGFLPRQAYAATTIDKVVLSLEYPVAGKAPADAAWYGQGYSVYDTEWYDRDDNRYLKPGDKIQVGHQYEVTIWVEADSGYVFKAANDNTPFVTATVNGTSGAVNKAYEYKAWAMITVSYYFETVPSKGWISSVDLTVPTPVTGAKPFYDKIETNSYHLANVSFSGSTDPKMKNGISWSNATNSQQLDPTTGEVFAPQTPYEFHCLVFPLEGYCITREARVRVNGKSAEAKLDYATFLSVNYTFPATASVQTQPELHVHTPGDLRYNSGEHYRYCTGCGEMVENEAHKGGKATCVEKGKCSVCGYAYLPENENHTPDTKWTACAGLYHAKLCKLCGAHCTPEEHKPGAAATETSPQTCTVCGYIIVPAKNHTHKLSKVEMVPATCLKEGRKEYYACSGCSDKFRDAAGKDKIPESEALELPALKHEYSGQWEHSETEHWMVCGNCKKPFEETRMEHDLQNGKCELCGYEEGTTEQKPPVNPEKEPEKQPATQNVPTKQKEDMDWLLPVAIGVVVFAAAIVAAVLILKKKKN